MSQPDFLMNGRKKQQSIYKEDKLKFIWPNHVAISLLSGIDVYIMLWWCIKVSSQELELKKKRREKKYFDNGDAFI